MLRKLFVLTEIATHGTTLFFKREAGNQQYELYINGVSYTFGFGVTGACVWTDQADADTFLMMNEQHFGGMQGATFQIQPIYQWYPIEVNNELASQSTVVE